MNSLNRNPDWLPLERALSAEFGAEARDAARTFHFIRYVPGPDDVGELRVYQHRRTHFQLTLDMDGRAYRYFEEIDRYGGADVENALISAIGR